MDGCVLLTSTPSCVVSPRGETTHSGVDVNNTHPSMINPLNHIHCFMQDVITQIRSHNNGSLAKQPLLKLSDALAMTLYSLFGYVDVYLYIYLLLFQLIVVCKRFTCASPKLGRDMISMAHCTSRRHQMETFPPSLALCEEIHCPPVDPPHKRQWRGALVFSLICAWSYSWANNRNTGDLTCHRIHYDVTAMQGFSTSSAPGMEILFYAIRRTISLLWTLSI